MVDQEDIKRISNNKDFEFGRVVMFQMKATNTRKCSERRVSTVDDWADAVSHQLSRIQDLPADGPFTIVYATQFSCRLVILNWTRGAVDEEKISAFMHAL